MHAGSATTLAGSWFRYDRASGWVLRGLDAAFSAGAVHAVVGGNGCGKSTMLSVLAKTVKLQRGHMERGAASAALLPQNPKALLVAETVRDELMEWASTCGYDEAVARERAASLGLSPAAASSLAPCVTMRRLAAPSSWPRTIWILPSRLPMTLP